MEEEEEDERREAAIASTPCLQPNFKPAGVSKAQLAKFQELHKRRLQIKERSKTKKKSKGSVGRTNRSQGKGLDECGSENSSRTVEDSSVLIPSSSNIGDISSQQDNVAAEMATKKRQKLHWGLDTKERWERKSNM